MKKSLVTFIILLVGFLYLSPAIATPVEAAFLNFDKNNVSAKTGDVFQIQVIVDAGGEQVSSTDAYVLYDSSLLEAQTASAGSFFPTVTNSITTGKVYIAGLVDDPATYKEGSGSLATITFKTLKDGSGTISFDCQPGVYNSSKIIKNDLNATNIIVCSQNGTATVNAGASGVSGPTPTALPKSGVAENIAAFAVPGLILLLLGGAARLLL